MFYKFCRFVCMMAFRIWFELDYSGMENIPNGGGYIIISNHQSNIDAILLAAKVKDPIHYMGKAELFENPILGMVFRGVHAFPVSRGSNDTTAIDTAVKIIEDREILGMFPEGTRSKDGKPLRPKSGAAMVTRITRGDVLPCGITYSNQRKFRSKVTVEYGKLIRFEEFQFTEEQSVREIKLATKLMFSQVLKLIGADIENG